MTPTRADLLLKAALGGADPAERRAVAEASAIDPDFVRDAEEIELMLGPLLLNREGEAPSEDLLPRIEAALEHGRGVERLDEGTWSDMLPGVRMKRVGDGGLVFLRCAPGAIIPAHRHPVAETLVVLAGDFSVDGVELFVGDTQRHEPGTEHSAASTRGGCLIALLYAA